MIEKLSMSWYTECNLQLDTIASLAAVHGGRFSSQSQELWLQAGCQKFTH